MMLSDGKERETPSSARLGCMRKEIPGCYPLGARKREKERKERGKKDVVTVGGELSLVDTMGGPFPSSLSLLPSYPAPFLSSLSLLPPSRFSILPARKPFIPVSVPPREEYRNNA